MHRRLRLRLRLRLVALSSLLVMPACSDGPTETPAAARVARLELFDPLPADAFVGRALAPKVRAYDAENRAVPGVRLRFATARATTTLQSETATTDAVGIAGPGTWSLPTRPTVDTLVVTVEGGRDVAPLRIPIGVRAGPIARWETLAPATGDGTVLESLLTGDAFRAYDPFDNPVGLAAVRVEATPASGGARVGATVDADAAGTFRLAEWTPRLLGTHTLRLVPGDGGGIASPLLTRTVRAPACAPAAAIPTAGGGFQAILTGVLRDDPAAACGDTLDRWALGVDSARSMGFFVRQPQSSRIVPFRIVHAGTGAAAALIVPDSASVASGGQQVSVLLPKGEYELVVGAGVTERLPYEISATDFGTGLTTSTGAYALPGVELERGTTSANQPAPEVGVPEAAGYVFVVPMRDPGRRQLRLTLSFTGTWQPVLAVSGRRDGATTRDSLAIDRGAGGGSTSSLVVDVPAAYQEALVYVIQPRPLPQGYQGTFRLRID